MTLRNQCRCCKIILLSLRKTKMISKVCDGEMMMGKRETEGGKMK